MIIHNFSGNFAAFLAAGLFGASVVATRVAVQEIPPLKLAVLRFGQEGSSRNNTSLQNVGVLLLIYIVNRNR